MYGHSHTKHTSKLKNWIDRYGVMSVVVLLVLGGGAGVYALTQPTEAPLTEQRLEQATTTRDEEPPEPSTEPAPLTGFEVEPEEARRPFTAVLIENSPNARPQTGLDAADIVFEAVSEGGITRYMGIYHYDLPEQAGPVRSMRPYFVDWVMGFDAPIAHVGGSAEALDMLANRGAKDLDQFDYAGPYSRSGSRPAPHNMYVNMSQLRDLQHDLGYDSSNITDFVWQDKSGEEAVTATDIDIDYSSSQYRARFRYDEDNNHYLRYLAGNPHIDNATDQQISVNNLVVVYMPTSQEGQYAVMDTIGEGNAKVFNDGVVTEGEWRQASYNERLKVVDSEGKQIPLNRGDTWIAIVPDDRDVSY